MKYTDPKYQNDIIQMVGDYCGKPVSNYTDDPIKTQLTWSFYHAFFFAFTVCSTVGEKKCTFSCVLLKIPDSKLFYISFIVIIQATETYHQVALSDE